MYLRINHLAKGFNSPLFEEVNLNVEGAAKIALIGDNGSGKSTLLKILAGQETTGSGEVLWSKDAKIGYLEQEIIAEGQEMSGGEKKILKITELFYGNYNALLLDEPDNHLDIEHREWFEQLVKEYPGIVIVISHDRKFLETGISRTWNLEEKKIRDYSYGYNKFKEIYEGEMDARQHLWETQEKERIRLADAVKRLREAAKANSKLSGRYQGMVKRYDKWVAEMVEKPLVEKTLKMKLETGKVHQRKTAIHVQNLNKAYGRNKVLKDLSWHVFCGEQVAIAAPNGVGKSTLLNILVGKINYDSGQVRIGEGLKLGYYAQEHLQALDERGTMIEELQKSIPLTWFEAIAYLKKFLFTADQAKTEVRFLSGGQKSRLQLAKFLGTNPDILVLDEPTNHLDLKTVIALERFLKDYQGTLVLVSHDRELVERVVDKVFELKDGKLVLGN